MRIIFTSAKSVLMRPGVVMRSVMPCTPCSSTSSAILNAFSIEVCSSLTWSRRSFGMTMIVSTFSFKLRDAGVGLHRTAATFERERTGHDTDRERADLLRDLRDDGRATGAGAAALARGDEHHVGALQHLFDLGAVLFGGLATDLGIGSGAEPAGELTTDVELHVGVGEQQRLRVGVDRDELDTLQARRRSSGSPRCIHRRRHRRP